MITSLSIENYALIEKLSIDFSEGFSTITGETGAGKSILLGALALVLGNRADLSSLKNKDSKCVVEAIFAIENYNLEDFFSANDLEFDNSTILRREILPTGKSRAFVNDSPVNLQLMQQLGNYLIDVHSQHQTQELSESNYQMLIVDSLAGTLNEVQNYRDKLKNFRKLESDLASTKDELQSLQREKDYDQFNLEELLNAKLTDDLQLNLEAEIAILSNSEIIEENLSRANSLMSDDNFGLVGNVVELRNILHKLSNYSDVYKGLSERVESVSIELKDISSELEDAASNISHDPENLSLLNDRLSTVLNLQKKHNVHSMEDLLNVQNELDNKAFSLSDLENKVEQLLQLLDSNRAEIKSFAKVISQKRQKALPKMKQQLEERLKVLGMPDAQVKLALDYKEEFFANGSDQLSFLMSANKGSDFGQLKKVASGGEMSRIMLAFKSILAQYNKLPTIIFDEIDTGVSGEIADRMGEVMKNLSQFMQVFAITHLPQIAAKGNNQYKVFKKSENETTQTAIIHLDENQRINEIAQMLSGSGISQSAVDHAKALLD